MSAPGKLLAAFASPGFRVFTPPGRTGSAFVAMAAAAMVSVASQGAEAAHAKHVAPARPASSTAHVRPAAEPARHAAAAVRHAPAPVHERAAQAHGKPVRESKDRTIHAIIRGASDGGVNPAFMLGVAWMESSLDTSAKSPSSSATGPLQFTKMAWVDAVWEHGAKHGLRSIVDGMDKGADGMFVISPRVRPALMQARSDPYRASVMAAEVFRSKAASLEQALGRKLQMGDGYILMFLGRGAAERFLAAPPSASTADVVPLAVKRNPEVFRTDQGKGRVKSVEEVRSELGNNLSAAMARFTGVTSPRADASSPDSETLPSTPSGRSPT